MRFNPWLVAVLAALPLLVLFVGLAAAAESLGSPIVVVMVAVVVLVAAVAARRTIGRAQGPATDNAPSAPPPGRSA
jgi:hypothetical protein